MTPVSLAAPTVAPVPAEVGRPPRGARVWVAALLALVALAAGALGALSGAPAGAADPVPTQAGGDEESGLIAGILQIREEGENRPVPGVTIVVTQGEETVATGASDAEGRWSIEVPRGDGYSVTLDTDTLPEGVDLRDEDNATLTDVRVTGLRRNLTFPLGPRVETPTLLDRFPNRFASGIKVGLIIGMAAAGLSLIFGVTGLVNFAHGELVTFGALMAYFFYNLFDGGGPLPLAVAGVLATGCGLLFGAALEKAVFGPLRVKGTGNVALIVFTIGLSLLLRYSYLVIFDNNPRPLYTTQRAVFLGLAPKDLAIIAVAIVAMVGVGLVLQLTRLGTAMRAVADERDLAASSGIDVKRIIVAVWAMGAALAALGGTLFATSEKVEWDLGFQQLLLMFAAVVLGGLGSAYGAMVGGLIVGIASELSTLWLPVDFKTAVALGVLIVVLLFRPQGVLGVRERLG